MEYSIRFSPKADKDLKKIPAKFHTPIFDRIDELKNNLAGDVTKLKKHDYEFRLRIGRYRVLFDTNKNVVTVQRIRIRGEAY